MIDYLYDGTFDGYLTAIFDAYSDKEEVHIYKEKDYSPSLLAISKIVVTDADKADRVYQSIYSKLSPSTLDNLYNVHLSFREEADTLGFEYIKLCYKYGNNINLAKNNDIIRGVDLINRQVWGETHNFFGFVRFKEIAPMLFYAAIEPDNNILPLMMNHFRKRFSDQHFIIHDQKRHTAIFYDTKSIRLQYLTIEESETLAKAEIKDPFEVYFKTYFDATTIKSRINPRLQNAHMPKRYYKHLIEVSK